MRSDNLSRNDKDAKNYIQTVILFHKYLESIISDKFQGNNG